LQGYQIANVAHRKKIAGMRRCEQVRNNPTIRTRDEERIRRLRERELAELFCVPR
jgi:hypothetical protein